MLDEAAGTRREIHFTPLSIVEGSKYDFSRIDFTAEKIQNELFQRFDIAACPTIELNDNYLRLIGLIKEFCALAENIMSGSCKMSSMTNQQVDLIFSAVKAVDDLHAVIWSRYQINFVTYNPSYEFNNYIKVLIISLFIDRHFDDYDIDDTYYFMLEKCEEIMRMTLDNRYGSYSILRKFGEVISTSRDTFGEPEMDELYTTLSKQTLSDEKSDIGRNNQ